MKRIFLRVKFLRDIRGCHISLFCVGIELSSRSVSRQVLLPLQSLTSVFGMGTGGPSALKTPTEPLTRCVGNELFSRSVSRQVLSPLQSLTSVFGMGTGGPSALKSPTLMEELQSNPCYVRSTWCTFRDSNPGPTD